MFKQRSNQKELMDDFTLASDHLCKNLDELAITNRWLGAEATLLNALNTIHQNYKGYIAHHKIKIIDIACGGGDLLLAINRWAKREKIAAELIGIDVNPFMIQYAKTKSNPSTNIDYRVTNVFSEKYFQIQPDIVTINSFCHHLSDEEFVRLLENLTQTTKLAIIINDLQRHWISYYAIKWLTRLFNCSYLMQHDAPQSVLRAFSKDELINLLKKSKITNFRIRKHWAFRWQVIILLL
jgi:2-polyprenyl-3-methyl-5-hydroxy-6-metoxy-1,4-benzoquinol methylase